MRHILILVHFYQIERSTVCLKYYQSPAKDALLGVVPLKNSEVYDVLGEAASSGTLGPKQLQKIIERETPDDECDDSTGSSSTRQTVRSSVASPSNASGKDSCTVCHQPFSFVLRLKYSCGNCFQAVCDDCSKKKAPLPHLGLVDAVRICDTCYTTTKLPKWNMVEQANCLSCKCMCDIGSVDFASLAALFD